MQAPRITNILAKPQQGVNTAHVRVVRGPDVGKTANIPAVGAVIGAGDTADVTIEDDSVSARHCIVKPMAQGFAVQDLDSKNGTWLDEVRITQAHVPVGSSLRLGNSVIQLVPAEVLEQIAPSDKDYFGELVGSSILMKRVYSVLERAAQSDAPVLILGESGTGKELAARALHQASPRRNGPFVVVDCGAASHELLRADLFGHKRGAFTDAKTEREGAWLAANGGTLFLDEIGDLPLELQPVLLRMLETKKVTPLGSHEPVESDVRVVAATHRDLDTMKVDGSFRADLFYRLAVVELEMPSLRQRPEDIEPIVGKMLVESGIGLDWSKSAKNLDRLKRYGWPGNIRELRNVLARASAMAKPGSPFHEMDITLASSATMPSYEFKGKDFHTAKREVVEQMERQYLRYVLESTKTITDAAKMAGVERKYLYKLLDKYSLRE